MAQAEVFSPAKINLFLAVTGRRKDGFHSLQSVVAPLKFGDKIRLEVSEGERSVRLSCSDPALPTDSGNLAYRAAELYLERGKLDRRVSIELDKCIPAGAGLGGGSSNAAVVLRGLNDLSGCFEEEELSSMAAELGSDCPLFLKSKPLIMKGRGEVLEDLPESVLDSICGRSLVVFKPSFSISTPWAYKQLANSPSNYMDSKEAEGRLGAFIKSGGVDLEGFLFNSFEGAIFEKMVGLRSMRELIFERLGLRMLMSGSGSSCFVLCEKEQVEELSSLVVDSWGKTAFIRASSIAD